MVREGERKNYGEPRRFSFIRGMNISTSLRGEVKSMMPMHSISMRFGSSPCTQLAEHAWMSSSSVQLLNKFRDLSASF